MWEPRRGSSRPRRSRRPVAPATRASLPEHPREPSPGRVHLRRTECPGRRRTKCSRTAPRFVTASSTTRSSGLSISSRPARTSSGVSPPRVSERVSAARRSPRTDRGVNHGPASVTGPAPPARLGKIGCLPVRVADRVEQLGERRRAVRLKAQVDGKAPQRHRDLGGLEIDLHDAAAGRGFNSHRHPGHVAIDDEHQISRPRARPRRRRPTECTKGGRSRRSTICSHRPLRPRCRPVRPGPPAWRTPPDSDRPSR